MKKIVALLLVAVMSLSMVACGTKSTETANNENNVVEKIENEEAEGFAPAQVEEESQEVADVVEEVIDTENLQKYYDATQYTGEPRFIENVVFVYNEEKNSFYTVGNEVLTIIPYDDRLKSGMAYDCIVVDNNTMEIGDDIIVYIFTE